jgi:rhodanese-related sulfurtransferase
MVRSINAGQAAALLERGEVEVIDVRDPAEWATGHLPGARLVPLAELRSNPTATLSRDGVLFVCAAGVRSQTAARIAAACGLTTIYSLNGGVRGWTKAGFALTEALSVAV